MLFDSLFRHAADTPHDTAVIDDTGQYTHRTLAAAAAGLGMIVRARTRQEHVGLLLPPSAGFVASFYGTLLAGKAVVPMISPASHRLSWLAARGLFAARGCRGTRRQPRGSEPGSRGTARLLR